MSKIACKPPSDIRSESERKRHENPQSGTPFRSLSGRRRQRRVPWIEGQPHSASASFAVFAESFPASALSCRAKTKQRLSAWNFPLPFGPLGPGPWTPETGRSPRAGSGCSRVRASTGSVQKPPGPHTAAPGACRRPSCAQAEASKL